MCFAQICKHARWIHFIDLTKVVDTKLTHMIIRLAKYDQRRAYKIGKQAVPTSYYKNKLLLFDFELEYLLTITSSLKMKYKKI
jgi:hypothetical protein